MQRVQLHPQPRARTKIKRFSVYFRSWNGPFPKNSGLNPIIFLVFGGGYFGLFVLGPYMETCTSSPKYVAPSLVVCKHSCCYEGQSHRTQRNSTDQLYLRRRLKLQREGRRRFSEDDNRRFQESLSNKNEPPFDLETQLLIGYHSTCLTTNIASAKKHSRFGKSDHITACC